MHSELVEVEVDCGGAGSEHSNLSQEIYLRFFLSNIHHAFYICLKIKSLKCRTLNCFANLKREGRAAAQPYAYGWYGGVDSIC